MSEELRKAPARVPVAANCEHSLRLDEQGRVILHCPQCRADYLGDFDRRSYPLLAAHQKAMEEIKRLRAALVKIAGVGCKDCSQGIRAEGYPFPCPACVAGDALRGG